jgi:5-methylcytosine-specific restriction enzyme subunit McrC
MIPLPTVNVMTLFERQSIPYETLGLAAGDPLLDTLDQLNQRQGKEIIGLERRKIRATQHVGVIQAGDRLIQILPKIDYDPSGNSEAPTGSYSQEQAAKSATRNFLYLLNHARKLDLKNQPLASLHAGRGTWLEMLTSLFAIELKTQLQQGFQLDYVRREDSLPYVRGRWNISRQFSRQPNLAQGLDVSYDDYSPDTLLNRIFHFAVNRLSQITSDPQIRQMLVNLNNWLDPVDLVGNISLSDLNRVEFNRLNERFQPAFQLARLFLEGQTVQLLAGGQRAFAYVFDMDKLFEQFVQNVLMTHARRILPEAWKDCLIEAQGSKSNKYMIQPPLPGEKSLLHLEPDLMLAIPGGSPVLILDTKNKALPKSQPYRDLERADVYQMFAYANRFHCPSALLLYPRMLGASNDIPFCLQVAEHPVRLYLATLDLHQPLDHLDRLIHDMHSILENIHLSEVNRKEALWPA